MNTPTHDQHRKEVKKLPATAFRPPDNRDFDAAAAAENIAMNLAMPVVAALKAGSLAKDLNKLPATTSQANEIIKIIDCEEPNLTDLRKALLEQCRELTEAKQTHPGAIGKRTIGELADRCLDIAVDCKKAIQRASADQ